MSTTSSYTALGKRTKDGLANNYRKFSEDEDDLPDGSFFRRTLCPRKQFNPRTQAIRPAKVCKMPMVYTKAIINGNLTNTNIHQLDADRYLEEVKRMSRTLPAENGEYVDLDYYLIIYEGFENNINNIKNSVRISKEEILKKTELFKERIFTDISLFNNLIKNETSTCYYSENCNRYSYCKKHLPTAGDYIKLYEVLTTLLIYDFDKNLLTIEEELTILESTVNITRQIINFKRARGLLKKTAVDEVTQWEDEMLHTFYDMYSRLWKIIISLINDFRKLGRHEEDLEQSIIKEIKNKTRLFACCINIFNFRIGDLICSDSEREWKESLSVSVEEDTTREY